MCRHIIKESVLETLSSTPDGAVIAVSIPVSIVCRSTERVGVKAECSGCHNLSLLQLPSIFN